MITREQFIAAYRAELMAPPVMAWVVDPIRLERFMATVAETLASTRGSGSWSHDGPVAAKVWRALGLPGKPTLKALRALPTESDDRSSRVPGGAA